MDTTASAAQAQLPAEGLTFHATVSRCERWQDAIALPPRFDGHLNAETKRQYRHTLKAGGDEMNVTLEFPLLLDSAVDVIIKPAPRVESES